MGQRSRMTPEVDLDPTSKESAAVPPRNEVECNKVALHGNRVRFVGEGTVSDPDSLESIDHLVWRRPGIHRATPQNDHPLDVACPAELRIAEASLEECVIHIHDRAVEVGAAVALTVSHNAVSDRDEF
jgi:hypothetical protein